MINTYKKRPQSAGN